MSSELRFSAGGASAPLTLKRSPRARLMRLRVDARTGSVVLTLPPRASTRKALEWAATNRAWVEEALARVPILTLIEPGQEIPFEGEPHRIEWNAASPRTPSVDEGRILIGGPLDGLESRLLRWLKVQARAVLEEETRHFAAKAGVSVIRIGIGDPMSRWGSCSSTGTIRYSWRLILAPVSVRRATVAHEVAHRIHMNHSPAFHRLVEQLLGWDPKEERRWLKEKGAALHRIGRGG